MLTLAKDDQPVTPDGIDKIVSAKLPEIKTSPKLHGIISELIQSLPVLE
jgi:hypothetical protein